MSIDISSFYMLVMNDRLKRAHMSTTEDIIYKINIYNAVYTPKKCPSNSIL